MVAFLALPILALITSDLLLVLVVVTPVYLKEFTLDIVSPSTIHLHVLLLLPSDWFSGHSFL